MNWSDKLKSELRECAARWTSSSGAQAYNSLGTPGTILFRRNGDAHGNFFGDVWTALTTDDAWARRLDKAHSQVKALPEDFRESAKELDSSNSSDALLMNCFCFPGASKRFHVRGISTPME